jgi:hypothetical protein
MTSISTPSLRSNLLTHSHVVDQALKEITHAVTSGLTM